MTPQCNATFYYTKPLLDQKGQVQVYNNKKSKNKKSKEKKIKCVIVGDTMVGKTSLAVSYSNDTFTSKYVPTAYDTYNVMVWVNGDPISLEICDTSGEDESLNPLRPLCYPGTDVFILCFSVVNPKSFLSASTRWRQELNKQNVPVVLVGTQEDLKSDEKVLRQLKEEGTRPVNLMEAKGLAEELGAPYIETSALKCNLLKEAFDSAITIALKKQRKRNKLFKKLCCI